MTRRRATTCLSLLALLGAASALLPACPTSTSTCAPACAAPLACDEQAGVCRAPRRARYAGASVPGRSARVVVRDGAPIVAVFDPARRQVLVGDPRGDAPRMVVLDELEGALSAQAPTLALVAGEQALHVVWASASGQLMLGKRTYEDTTDRWTVEAVAVEGGSYTAGQGAALVVAPDGLEVIVFHDAQAGTLRALRRVVAGGAWAIEEVDRGAESERDACPARGGLGLFPSAVRTSRGELYVAYHDASCGTLRLARWREGLWSVEVLDQGAERDARTPDLDSITGRHTALALDAEGALLIAYQDATRGRLLYGKLAQDRFTREVVDPGLVLDRFAQQRPAFTGAFNALTLDASNQPVITTMNATDAELLRARRVGGAWELTTLADEGLVGFFAHHARDAATGRAVIVSERISPGGGSSLVLIDEVGQ